VFRCAIHEPKIFQLKFEIKKISQSFHVVHENDTNLIFQKPIILHENNVEYCPGPDLPCQAQFWKVPGAPRLGNLRFVFEDPAPQSEDRFLDKLFAKKNKLFAKKTLDFRQKFDAKWHLLCAK